MTETDEIVALQEAERAARQAYDEARARLDAAVLAAAPYKVGDVIRVRMRHGGVRRVVDAIVRSVNPRWGTQVSYKVAAMNKTGEWSRAERSIWESDIVTEEADS